MSTSTSGRLYEYKVRDKQGRIVKGRIEAANEGAVASRLKTMGVAPLEISEVSTTGLNAEIKLGFGSGVGLKDLAVMTRQLATMVSAGLSLLRAVSILAEQTENKVLAGILGQVRGDIETGHSLSVAFAKHPREFPPIMINMVRAGETGGFLEKSLLSIAANFEAEVKLQQKVKSAMTYPVVVFVMAILAVIGMLLFIVPIFSGMFESLGGELPAPTKVLVWLSGVLKVAGIPIALVLVAIAIWWGRHKNDESVRRKADPMKLKAPIFGPLAQKISISRFTRNFGTMLGSGVPILLALDIVGETAGNIVVEDAVKDVREAVRKGEALTAPLSRHSVFPPMVVQMMAVGEDSGSLELMLEKISDFYDDEVEATTEQLTSLIEPLMIGVLGVIVGGMLIALYMPIFSIFELIG
ncbi:type II secretion system F family protein [Flavimobilis sp. GY10621]|uniref:Type II secretion system F family protein n=1 Tax=Flavimobilis rhizosphaerae TaxID=2775421 RepID=A0ABR9DTB2_9MICO|nr:type II secretion system F family protein [Flavimobilis rhizosphaerae]MBD9700372.1 type II secretion system F family protein [Flavimobilis rhizosphaerae]